MQPKEPNPSLSSNLKLSYLKTSKGITYFSPPMSIQLGKNKKEIRNTKEKHISYDTTNIALNQTK